MPGTDIPVVSPAELIARKPDSVLLFLPDLRAEVRAAYPEVEAAGGRWVAAEMHLAAGARGSSPDGRPAVAQTVGSSRHYRDMAATSGAAALTGFSEATRAWFDVGVRRADACPGAGLECDRQGRPHAGHRADRLRQDARRVPVGDRPAGQRACSGRSQAALPGAVRLAAEGAGRRRRAEPALAADRHPARAARGSACPSPTSRSASGPATPPPTSAASSSASRRTS